VHAQPDAGVNYSLKDFEDVKIVIRHVLAQTHRHKFLVLLQCVRGIILINMQSLSGGGKYNMFPTKLCREQLRFLLAVQYLLPGNGIKAVLDFPNNNNDARDGIDSTES
jgi:hypothetical protein